MKLVNIFGSPALMKLGLHVDCSGFRFDESVLWFKLRRSAAPPVNQGIRIPAPLRSVTEIFAGIASSNEGQFRQPTSPLHAHDFPHVKSHTVTDSSHTQLRRRCCSSPPSPASARSATSPAASICDPAASICE